LVVEGAPKAFENLFELPGMLAKTNPLGLAS